jgi:hypothetical protein
VKQAPLRAFPHPLGPSLNRQPYRRWLSNIEPEYVVSRKIEEDRVADSMERAPMNKEKGCAALLV